MFGLSKSLWPTQYRRIHIYISLIFEIEEVRFKRQRMLFLLFVRLLPMTSDVFPRGGISAPELIIYPSFRPSHQSNSFLDRKGWISLRARRKMSKKSGTWHVVANLEFPPTKALNRNRKSSLPCSIFMSDTYHFSIHSTIPVVQTYLSTCNITSLLARLWS